MMKKTASLLGIAVLGGVLTLGGYKIFLEKPQVVIERIIQPTQKIVQANYTATGNVVANNYLFLFQNTDSKPHTYALEIIDNKDIEITRFRPLRLSPKKLAKKVIVLRTNKLLVNDNTKDTPITLTIKAYAIDEPEKIVVFRKVVFIFPRADKLK